MRMIGGSPSAGSGFTPSEEMVEQFMQQGEQPAGFDSPAGEFGPPGQ